MDPDVKCYQHKTYKHESRLLFFYPTQNSTTNSSETLVNTMSVLLKQQQEEARKTQSREGLSPRTPGIPETCPTVNKRDSRKLKAFFIGKEKVNQVKG